MRIIIVRHGAAVATASSDAERELTEQGVMQARAVGAWLASELHPGNVRESATPPVLRCSPYLRAQQTAQGICEALSIEFPQTYYPELLPNSGPQQALSLCSEQHEVMILVSHQPLVGRLLNHLVYEDDLPFFNTACAAIIELDIDGAVAANVAQGSMRLQTFFHPEV